MENAAEEQQEWDSRFKRRGRPSTWEECAGWVDEYMQLKEGWVAFEERNTDKKKLVRPTPIQALYDILHFRRPRMREKVERGPKYAFIKLMDKHGELIVHATFEYDALAVFDGEKVVEIGKKLKRAIEKDKTHHDA